jgi:ketosteroid isomerase-like protein
VSPREVYGNPGARDVEIETVRAIYDAFARRDLDAALAYISEQCEFRPTGTAQRLGRTAPYIGHAGMREYFADAARVWDDLVLHADDIRAAAGGVIVFGHIEGKTGGELVRRRALWSWQVRDGLATAMSVSDLGQV